MFSNGYLFQIETTYKAFRRGCKVKELPIIFYERRVGLISQIRAAAQVWNSVESSELRLAFGGFSPAGTSQNSPVIVRRGDGRGLPV